MAVLQQPTNMSHPFADAMGEHPAPAGTYQATILDIKDEFGIQRQKYQSTEMETVDLTCFLFGFQDAQGAQQRIASKRMRISGNEKSNLYKFLKSLLGKAPEYGWDYCALKGHTFLLTVEQVPRRDGNGVYAGIAALSPLPAGVPQAMAPVAPPAQAPLAAGGPPALQAGVPAPKVQGTAGTGEEPFPF